MRSLCVSVLTQIRSPIHEYIIRFCKIVMDTMFTISHRIDFGCRSRDTEKKMNPFKYSYAICMAIMESAIAKCEKKKKQK